MDLGFSLNSPKLRARDMPQGKAVKLSRFVAE